MVNVGLVCATVHDYSLRSHTLTPRHPHSTPGAKAELRDCMRMFHRWQQWCVEDKHTASYHRLSQVSQNEYNVSRGLEVNGYSSYDWLGP